MKRAIQRGFTILEVMVALTVLATVVMFVYQILQNAVRGEQMVREDLRKPKVENAVLRQIVGDFRYLYWDGFSGNTGFIGRSRTIGGMEADSIDFVTARRSRTAHTVEGESRELPPSPVTEVGYALRQNDSNPEWMELWRREDWFVDDDPLSGGKYSPIYDKIRKFEMFYFPIPELQTDPKGLEEWDSRLKGSIPYAIFLEIKFDVESQRPDGDYEDTSEFVSRIIILRNAYSIKREGAPGQGDGTGNG